MIVPVQLSTLPVTPRKNGAGETREIVCVPSPDAPFYGEPALPPCKMMARFPAFPASTGSLLYWPGSRCA